MKKEKTNKNNAFDDDCFIIQIESALTGELKISRLSTLVGGAIGDDDLFMFVEKVGKSMLCRFWFFAFLC